MRTFFVYERYESHLDFIEEVKNSDDWQYIVEILKKRAKEEDPDALLKSMIEECEQNMKKETFKTYWVLFHDAEKTMKAVWYELFSYSIFKSYLMLMLRVEWVEQNCPVTSRKTRQCDPLHTPKAMELWKRLQDKGLVDENLQPTVSNRKAAIIADELATALNLEPRWRAIEKLWGKSNLSTEYSKSVYMQYYDTFKKEIHNMLQ